jgi:dinuclear metal center YbgI/SA1388 family protein
MASRDEILSFCHELLAPDSFQDYGPNGLQVPGGAEVSKLATGVSANRATLERAIAGGAQLVLCHHGLFWESQSRALTPTMAQRLRILLDAGVSLAAYHLPLDAHPEIGNNALLCERLEFEPAERFAEVKGAPIGLVGRSGDGVSADQLGARVTALLGREPLIQGAGPETVRSMGFVSGAGAGAIHEAAALGLDALLTGEPAEHAMADAAENRMHFLAAGHYATETLGIRRLGQVVGERFGVEHEFVDVQNPV